MNTNTTTTAKRLLVGFVMAATIGTAAVAGTGVATADAGSDSGNVTDASSAPVASTAPSSGVERRTHKPITITKEYGPSTPQLFQATP